MLCVVSVSHMISRCCFSYSLHVLPPQPVIQIFQVPFTAMKTLLHAQSLHISIITRSFRSPQHHWLRAFHVARLSAMRRSPFRCFRERGHEEFTRNFRTRWNTGLKSSSVLYLYFSTKRFVARLHHNYVRQQQFAFRRFPAPSLATRDVTFLFLFILRIFVSTYT